MSKSVRRRIGHDLLVNDGVICNAINEPDTSVRYTYLDFGRGGFDIGSIVHKIVATTLTIEMTNIDAPPDTEINGIIASATTAGGATMTALTLKTTWGFSTDDDLIGAVVEVTADATTPVM